MYEINIFDKIKMQLDWAMVYYGIKNDILNIDIAQEFACRKLECDDQLSAEELLIFYRVDGLSYLEDKSDNAKLPQWSSFIKKLYDSILTGKYQRGKIGFKVPLSKLQLFKLKKVITEEENIFIENIEGKCFDIDL